MPLAGLSLGLVVAGAVVVVTAMVAIVGVLVDRSASRYEGAGNDRR